MHSLLLRQRGVNLRQCPNSWINFSGRVWTQQQSLSDNNLLPLLICTRRYPSQERFPCWHTPLYVRLVTIEALQQLEPLMMSMPTL